jgi:hypothetical protein
MIKTFTFSSIFILQIFSLVAIDLTPEIAYELFAKEAKSAFVDKKIDEKEIDRLLKVYDKVFINAQHYPRKEIDNIISHRKKIHLIIPDTVYDRWNATRLIDRAKERMLIISNKWNSWDVRRLSERRVKMFVNAKRFDLPDIQKILESGAYVLIDSEKLTMKEFQSFVMSDARRLIITTDGEDLHKLERVQRKGAQIVMKDHLTRVNLSPPKRGVSQEK